MLSYRPQSKLNVHLLEFHELTFSHVEIVLEAKSENSQSEYYFINVISVPKKSATTHATFFLKRIKNANRKIMFELEHDLEEIIQAWHEKYHTRDIPINLLCCDAHPSRDTCADVANWFLETYLNIKNPGPCGPPITCNYFCCGFFLPSFVQPLTLPGRIMDIAEHHQRKQLPAHSRIRMNDN